MTTNYTRVSAERFWAWAFSPASWNTWRKRSGPLVSLRVVLSVPRDVPPLKQLAAALLRQAEQLLGDSVQRLAALAPSSAREQLHLLAGHGRGQTALVSLWQLPESQQPVLWQLVVVGTRGVVSLQGGPVALEGTGALPADAPEELEQAVALSLEKDQALQLQGQQWHPVPSHRAEALQLPEQEPDWKRLQNQPKPWGVLLVAGKFTHQENYGESFAQDPRCRLVAVTDGGELSARRRELNRQWARRLKLPYLEDYQQALARPDVHIVSVCAEPDRRAALEVQAAAAGKAIYLDKPLCTTRQEAQQVAQAMAQHGVPNQMFSLVWVPQVQQARSLLAQGVETADQLHYELFFAKGHPGTATLDHPRQETYPPGLLEGPLTKREWANVGVYTLAALRHLLGPCVRRVFAITGNYFFSENQAENMEDFAAALLELDEGRVMTVRVGRTGWRSHPHYGVHRLLVAGPRGGTLLDVHEPHLAFWVEEPPWPGAKRHPGDPMGFWSSSQQEMETPAKNAWLIPPWGADDIRRFVDCLDRGRRPLVTALEAAQSHHWLLAGYESAARGGWIEV